PALGLRPQVADVAEHLRQRHHGSDDAIGTPLLHRLNGPTPGVEVTDDVAHVVLWGVDLAGHHRLEQHRVRLTGSFLERHGPGDLEGHLGRVDLVVLTVHQCDLQTHQRIAGEHAVLHGVLAPG